MVTEPIKKVCVVGVGVLGMRIGLQCAAHGYATSFVDVSKDILDRTMESCKQELQGRVEKKQITTSQKETILRRIQLTTSLKEGASDADLVIEAVPERLETKREVFNQLDKICPSHTIITTNSSSIRISRIEDATRCPDRVLNTHFFSSIWRNTVVELMRGTKTSDETLERVKQFARSLELTPMLVRKESTGFIYNRVWRAIKRECLHVVAEGVATPEDVDRIWMAQWDAPIGPFGRMDNVGLDVVRDIEMVYYEESGDERDKPPQFLLDKIARGELGVKSGKGFYTYPNPAYKNPAWLKGSE